MPIYEFVCLDCGQKSSFLVPSFKTSLEPKCRTCGCVNMRKLVSRVAVLRSEGSGDDLGDEFGGESSGASGSMDYGGDSGFGQDDGGDFEER